MIESSPEPPPSADLIRLLFFGDVVGEPGRRALSDALPDLKKRLGADFVIVNGENAAGGRGITPKIAIGLLRAGAAVITTGDHIWDQGEIMPYLETEPRVLRPANYPDGAPGAGSIVLEAAKAKVAVLNLQGRTFMGPLDNPFLAAEAEVARLRAETPIILVDFHAEATSEKIALGRMLDGQVSAVIGTHTHVQTADESIFPGGTAYLSDAGMCGPAESVLGRKIEPVVERFRNHLPARFPVAKGDVRLCGAVIDVEIATGHATRITRLSEFVRCP
ncbi:MAG: TIGR00282 family metallophosphoesterase [Verrucomicrobiales bacterium]